MRTVAVLQAVACALVLWALVFSVTPRVLAPEQLDLLTMQPVARLADGRWVTKARFETGPILGAPAKPARERRTPSVRWGLLSSKGVTC